MVTGVGIVLRTSWAYWVGMVVSLVLFVPAVPYITIVGLLIIYVLWRGRPGRKHP